MTPVPFNPGSDDASGEEATGSTHDGAKDASSGRPFSRVSLARLGSVVSSALLDVTRRH